MTEITYGPGGFDPSHPNGNIIEQVVDNGDGTGTRTLYGPDGQVTGTEALTGLPIPDPPAADPAAAVLAAVQTARNEVAGYAASNGTRQAVEALATAAEALTAAIPDPALREPMLALLDLITSTSTTPENP